jgi:hypothetical protein
LAAATGVPMRAVGVLGVVGAVMAL